MRQDERTCHNMSLLCSFGNNVYQRIMIIWNSQLHFFHSFYLNCLYHSSFLYPCMTFRITFSTLLFSLFLSLSRDKLYLSCLFLSSRCFDFFLQGNPIIFLFPAFFPWRTLYWTLRSTWGLVYSSSATWSTIAFLENHYETTRDFEYAYNIIWF